MLEVSKRCVYPGLTPTSQGVCDGEAVAWACTEPPVWHCPNSRGTFEEAKTVAGCAGQPGSSFQG